MPSLTVSFHRQVLRQVSHRVLDDDRILALRMASFCRPWRVREWVRLRALQIGLSVLIGMYVTGAMGGRRIDAEDAAQPAAPVPANPGVEMLHQRIDSLLDEAHIGPVAKTTDDGEFLRRISLDLIGRLPTLAEMDQFASEPAEDRRAKWIDRLLASTECDKHLAVVLDVTWMERRPDFYVPTNQWREYLRQSLAKGQPLNELVAEVLGATGADDAARPRSKFLVDRNVESHLLTRDVGRMFFGRDLQCAQCHDHPLISDYAQDEYYGLFAFVQRSFLVTMDADKKIVSVGEKADGDAVFASVFEPDVPKRTALPSLPDGGPLVEEPSLAPADAYLVAPADKVRSVPKFSRREQLAAASRLGESRMFRRNAANRIWRMLMKRGLVEPPDLMHSGNPASHPLLLDEMSEWFAAKQFSVKALLAEVARTKAYQRQVDLPPLEAIDINELTARVTQWKSAAGYQTELVKRINEQLSDARSKRIELEKQFTELRATLQQKLTEQHAASQKQAEAQGKLQAVEAELQQKRTALAALQSSAQQAQLAAAQLPSDTELAAASQLLATRVQTLTDAIPPLEQQLGPLQQAAKEASGVVTSIQAEVTTMRPQADVLALQIKEQGGVQQLLQRQQLSESAREVEWTQRIAYAEQLAAWIEVDRGWKELEASRNTVAMELKQSIALRAQNEQQMQKIESELMTNQKLVDGIHGALAKIHDSYRQVADAEKLALQVASDGSNASEVPFEQIRSALTENARSLRERFGQLSTEAEKMVASRAELLAKMELQANELTAIRASFDAASLRVADLERQQSELAAQGEKRSAEREQKAQRVRLAWTHRFAAATLQGLSPEQLAGSAVVGLGLDRRFRAESTSEWQEKNKEKKPEEISQEQRATDIESLYQQRYQQVDATFVSLFAGAPGSPQDAFQATVDQALFWANDGRVQGWVAPTGGSLAEQLIALQDDQAVIELAYRSLLSRLPDAGERQRIGEFLAAGKDDRPRAIQDLIWSLLTSVEFRFNH